MKIRLLPVAVAVLMASMAVGCTFASRNPPTIKTLGLCIFVEQEFERMRVAARPSRRQWRRQMADRNASDAALGLRRFARIGRDERIDDRQGAGDNLWKTRRRQRDSLAGQPFQRAMGA